MAVEKIELNTTRPQRVRVLLAQMNSDSADWEQRQGLYFLKRWIESVISHARANSVDLIILPELSVPIGVLDRLQSWSKETGTVIIAGSHYASNPDGKYISRCPVIISGDIHFTDKMIPAPAEKSPIAGEGLQPGHQVRTFHDTRVGSFGVLICSDYLEPRLRQEVLDQGLDFVCIPAFQRKSEPYHSRMNVTVDESIVGVYCLYANMNCDGLADGRSAVFGLMDDIYIEKLISARLTDQEEKHKVLEMQGRNSFLVAEIDIAHKRPSIPRNVHSEPNILFIASFGDAVSTSERFTAKIAHEDPRYRDVLNLFVEPKEFGDIRRKLSDRSLVFIVGDPGIGKTYCAARLLREYFDKGYDPVWYTGLEKEERLIQRQVLETFQPRNNQIIYFEDPFGRTVFERRDAIYQVFGPLHDRLREVNAKVVVTSRKDVFERFLEEGLNASELLQFAEEMSVVKPSYSSEELALILKRLASERCLWYSDDTCRRLVEQHIVEGKLTTPLAIRDLVYSTESTKEIGVLEGRLRRREHEAVLSFSGEIQALSPSGKLTLLLVLLFGSGHQSALLDYYDTLSRSAELSYLKIDENTFMEEIRRQIGHRIEQYGSKRTAYRFSHPVYEEAFVEVALNDGALETIMIVLIHSADEKELRKLIDAVLRNRRKYDKLTASLIRPVIDACRRRQEVKQLSYIGSRLIAAIDNTGDEKYLKILTDLASLSELIVWIGFEQDVLTMTELFRLLVNYCERSPDVELESIEARIDWGHVLRVLRTRGVFNVAIYAIQWISRIRPTIGKEYFYSNPSPKMRRRLMRVPDKEFNRFVEVVNDDHAATTMKVWRSAGKNRSWRSLLKEVCAEVDGKAVTIDDGAVLALVSGRAPNLLPIGIVKVDGRFEVGDAIALLDEKGRTVGFGLSEYSSDEIAAISRHHSGLIPEILGIFRGNSTIKRANMMLSR